MKKFENTIFFKKLLDNPFVYHYTSIDALFSILEEYRENGGNTLPFRAGCVYKTNDSREMALGYDTLKSILPQFEKSNANSIGLSGVYGSEDYEKQCKEQLFQKPIDGAVEMSTIPYTISFSCKRDFLPMWAMYGDGKKGVCLKFSLNKLISCLPGIPSICFVHYDGDEPNIINDYLLPSVYDIGPKRISREISIEEKISELSILCDCISPFVKTKDWAYEEEFRIAYFERYGLYFDDGFHFALKKKIIEDHITLPIDAKSLEEIIIGPLSNYKVVEHVLRNELNECLLSNVDITRSSIMIAK